MSSRGAPPATSSAPARAPRRPRPRLPRRARPRPRRSPPRRRRGTLAARPRSLPPSVWSTTRSPGASVARSATRRASRVRPSTRPVPPTARGEPPAGTTTAGGCPAAHRSSVTSPSSASESWPATAVRKRPWVRSRRIAAFNSPGRRRARPRPARRRARAAGERGQRRRLRALLAHVADGHGPAARRDLEQVVEVATDLVGLARRAVAARDLEAGDVGQPGRQERGLERPRGVVALPVQARVLDSTCRRSPGGPRPAGSARRRRERRRSWRRARGPSPARSAGRASGAGRGAPRAPRAEARGRNSATRVAPTVPAVWVSRWPGPPAPARARRASEQLAARLRPCAGCTALSVSCPCGRP